MNIDEMREGRSSYTSIYMEFLSAKYDLLKDSIEIIFFLEGKDDIKYYKSKFEMLLKEKKYTHFTVGGKKNVLRLKEYMEKKEESDFVFKFMVDKDFEKTLKQRNLYVTPYYSIENFYISTDVFKKILETNFSLNKYKKEDKEDFERIMELYKERKKEYLDALDEIIKFYYHQKINGVNLSNINEITKTKKPLIKISLDKIEKKYDLEILKTKVPNFIELEEMESSFSNLKIRKNQRKYYYRGKYLLEFLEKFVTLLIQDANSSEGKYFSNKKNVSSNVTGNILSVFSSCSETPICLKNFLEKIV